MGISVKESFNMDKLFRQLGDDRERTKAIRKGLKKGGNEVIKVARQKVAFNKSRKEGKHLKAAIGQKFKKYRSHHVQIIGPRRNKPWFGFHAHFIALGLAAKTLVRRIRSGKSVSYKRPAQAPRPFMKPAARVTRSKQDAAIEGAMVEFIKDAGG